MNKYFIVLLAVCLVSVHAYVKRDAPATAPASTTNGQNYLEDFQKQLETFTKNVNDNFANTFKINPDDIKKQFNELTSTINKAFDSMKEKQA